MFRKSIKIHLDAVCDIITYSTLVFIACLCLICFTQPAIAAVTWTGEVDPADPTTWTSSTDGYIGKTANGTLTVDSDSDLSSGSGYIGYGSGVSGEVTIDGAGSTWTNSGDYLYVGNSGSGTLNITNGGTVTAGGTTWVSRESGSSGTINFNDGTLTTGGLLAASDDFTGTGTINTHGLVSDVDLVFNSTYGLNQILNITRNPGQDITINLTVDGTRAMGAGFSGNGSMSISEGRVVESTEGYIGYNSGSLGEVTVDGVGSMWANSGPLWVGGNLDGSGSGSLNVTDGGVVSNNSSVIGYYDGSKGEVTVNGVGSTWTNNDILIGGLNAIGTLNITDGGLVSVADTLFIDPYATGDCFINMYNGGMLALYGDAGVSLEDFLDLIDGTDAIRYWDDSISNWANITGAIYGRDYVLGYLSEGDLSGYTLLTVERVMDGDANGDGKVDVSDLGVLATNYGATSGAEWSDGDFNSDKKVDVSDLGILATHYGTGTAVAAVPEPGSIALLLCGLVGLTLRRRRR